jgi:TadE-like protein
VGDNGTSPVCCEETVVNLHKLLNREVRGQAMIETALVLPVLLGLAFNVVNFGYFFLVIVNLAAAPRVGALYSILGAATPVATSLPSTGSVNTLTIDDLTGAVYNASGSKVQVCTAAKGTTPPPGSPKLTECDRFNSFTATTPAADPEEPSFVLNQVDVIYSFTPLIDSRLFNLILLGACPSSGGTVTCTFHRKVLMRAMN